jgi:hypothetical protein
MPKESSLGLVIGAAFGTVFVLANAHPPVNGIVGASLRALAVLALAVVVAGVLRLARRAPGGQVNAPPDADEVDWYGTGFRLVVGAEVALLAGGIAAVRIWDGPEEAIVAWVAFVVGLHLVAFAPLWGEPDIAVPGVALAVLGATGLALAFTSAAEWVPLVSGVLSGVTLLGCSLFAVARHRSPSLPGRHEPT